MEAKKVLSDSDFFSPGAINNPLLQKLKRGEYTFLSSGMMYRRNIESDSIEATVESGILEGYSEVTIEELELRESRS